MSTPAGIAIVSVRSRRVRPSPWQSWQGSLSFSPAPWHSGQGLSMAKKPWRNWTRPRPRQTPQVTVPLPPFPPVPWQASQRSKRRIGRLFSTPKAASSKVSVRSARRSSPGGRRPRRPPPAPIPKKSPRMSAKSTKAFGSNPPVPLRPLVPEPVVAGPLLGIGEDRVGLRRLPEPLLRLGIAGVAVGVVIERQLAVGRLDLVRRGVAGDAEDLVEIAGCRGHLGPLEAIPSRALARSCRASPRSGSARRPACRGGRCRSRPAPRPSAPRGRAGGSGRSGPARRC